MGKAIFITVRTGSIRLPDKALLKIKGKHTIEHLIHRVKQTQLVDNIILCTTILPEDDILCEIAERNNIQYFRGSLKDKLERWKGACEKFDIEFFVTADGDDLFCDPELIDLAFKQYEKSEKKIDFIQADKVVCGAFTYGIKSAALKHVCNIKNTQDTEMMWVYFTETNLFNVKELEGVHENYYRDDIRMTLDYEEDFQFFKKIINYFETDSFSLQEIISYIDQTPKIKKINFHRHEEWAQNQINKTKLAMK